MKRKYVITFAGDTSLGSWYIRKSGKKELLQKLENCHEFFSKGIKTLINHSDYLILNLETVLADNPEIYFPEKKYPNSDKAEHLLKLLNNVGVTAVNLANNHTMDFGPNLMLETKKLLEENIIQTFGAGKNIEEAERPYKITLTGERSAKNIYIIGGMNTSKRYQEEYNFFASDDNPGINSLNLNRWLQLINKIRGEDHDSTIILFPHWQGIDYKHASENKEIHFNCSKLIECGADFIIGHGTHMIDTSEKIESGIIAYSIGNFIFNSKGRYKKYNALPYSAIARLIFEENEYNWSINPCFYPIVSDNEISNYQPRLINENEYGNLLKALSGKNIFSKNSFGYYFTPMDNTELISPFQDKKIDDCEINNIIFQNPNEYKDEIFSSKKLISKEFNKKGYTTFYMKKYLIANVGKENIVFNETESTYDSSIGVRIAKEKDITRKFLKMAGLNIVKGESFSVFEKEKALNYALSLPSSVIKPSDGHKGIGISVGVKTKEEFENAWKNAVSATNNKILVEEQFIGGTEARCLVINGYCAAVFSSIAPNVTGNGVDTIQELIKQKNEIRLQNPHLNNRLIEINDHRISIIKNQGYNLYSIPPNGANVIIDWNRNVGKGGDSLDITDDIHPLYKKIAEKAANSIPGLFTVGVDIIADDFSIEPQENSYAIIEVNTRPGIGGHHYPMFGKPRNVAKNIVEQCINRVLKERGEANSN